MKTGKMALGRRWLAAMALGSVLATGALGQGSGAGEVPEWSFEIEESELVWFETQSWHRKDYGWLFTCRLRVASLNLIDPITHLEFNGFDAEEQVVWTKRKVIREKDFDGTFKGGEGQFVRVMLEDVPPEVVRVELSFDPGDEEAEEL